MKLWDTGFRLSLKIFATAMLVSLIESRKTYLVKQQHPSVTIPKVTGYDSSWCITMDDSYTCINVQTQWELGWETYQDYGTYTDEDYMYWILRPQLYTEQAITVVPQMRISEYYYGALNADVEQFTASIWPEMVLFLDDYTICGNVGWSTEEILVSVTTSMNFMDCYKIIIKTLLDFSNWTELFDKLSNLTALEGFEELFDSCSDSNDDTVTFYEYNPYTDDTDKYLLGEFSKDGDTCFDTESYLLSKPYGESVLSMLSYVKQQYQNGNIQTVDKKTNLTNKKQFYRIDPVDLEDEEARL